MTEVQILAEARRRFCSLFHQSRPTLDAHPAFYLMGTKYSFPDGKVTRA